MATSVSAPDAAAELPPDADPSVAGPGPVAPNPPTSAIEPAPRDRPAPTTAPRGFWWAVAAATVVTLLGRAWALAGGWFYADDIVGIARAARGSLGEVVTYGEGGHVAWLGNAFGWWFSRTFGFSWPAYVARDLVWIAVLDLLVLWLVVRLWGRRWPVLGLYACWLLTPLLTPAFLWSSQLGLTFWLLAPSLLVALALVRVVEGGRWWWSAATVALFAGGLAASERVVVLFPVLAALVLLAAPAVGVPTRQAARRAWPALAALAVVAVAFLAVYRTYSDGPTAWLGRGIDWGPAVASFFTVVLPALVGGPWGLDSTRTLARADTPVWGVLLAVQLVVLVAALGIVRQRWRGAAAVTILLALAAVDVALVAIGRVGSVGEQALTDWRYYGELAAVLPLVLGVLFVSPRAPHGDRPDRPDRWPVVRRWFLGEPRLAVLVVFLLVQAALVTSVALAVEWRDNPARPYLTNALADLAAGDSAPVLVDSQLPPEVVPPFFLDASHANWILSAAPRPPVFDRPSAAPQMLGPDGHLVPADITGGTAAVPGPDGACGYAVAARPREIPLANPLFDWTWLARIDYLASSDTVLQVADGRAPVDVPVVRGAGSVYVPLAGPVAQVTIASPDGVGVCVSGVRVGTATPRTAG